MQTKEELQDKIVKLLHKWKILTWHLSRNQHTGCDVGHDHFTTQLRYKELSAIEATLSDLNSKLKVMEPK